MDIDNTIDFGLEADARYGGEYIEIESLRFDKASRKIIDEITQPGSQSLGNKVLRISCLFVKLDYFKKIRPLGRYSGEFFPDKSCPFKLRDFDLYFRPDKVIRYDDYMEISDVSMVIYAVQ